MVRKKKNQTKGFAGFLNHQQYFYLNHASSKTRLGGAAALPAVRCLRATARWAADERQPQVLPVQGGPSALAAVDDARFFERKMVDVVVEISIS